MRSSNDCLIGGLTPQYVTDRGQNAKLHKTQINIKMYSVNLTDKPANIVDDVNYRNGINTNVVINI